jgi:hypothetical protein
MTPMEYIETILKYVASVEFIVQSNLIRKFSNTQKGHLRMRLAFKDGSFLEFYEYLEQTETEEIEVITYAYHWSTNNGELIYRWDNTPHYPHLPNAPHHIHHGELNQVTSGQATNIFAILNEIERNWKKGKD